MEICPFIDDLWWFTYEKLVISYSYVKLPEGITTIIYHHYVYIKIASAITRSRMVLTMAELSPHLRPELCQRGNLIYGNLWEWRGSCPCGNPVVGRYCKREDVKCGQLQLKARFSLTTPSFDITWAKMLHRHVKHQARGQRHRHGMPPGLKMNTTWGDGLAIFDATIVWPRGPPGVLGFGRWVLAWLMVLTCQKERSGIRCFVSSNINSQCWRTLSVVSSDRTVLMN